ncbi:LysR substrate-binding domain-containing protein [Halomonas sp. HNIBRBA4712]|uniref:LysR substrate-binding domain-containing protein n=1 Tax=Halomonas sp. HNIBRBA4712 TaxID=3373087 RepID=UPI0037461A13
MHRSRLPLNALRAFAEAAEQQSFKRAAQTLGVSPGAVSRQVKLLEARLNTPLFERHARGVVVNEAGKLLATEVQAGLSRMVQGVEKITRRESNHFELVISAPPSFLQLWLLPRLPQFEASERSIHISLDADARLTPPMWPPNRARLSLRYGQPPWPGVESHALFEDRLFPVCAPALLERQHLESPEDLLTQTLLAVDWETTSRVPDWADWFEQALGASQRLPRQRRYSLYSMALDQAIAGQGVVLASYPLIADRLASGVLVRPFGERHAYCSGLVYALILPPGGETPAPVARFIEWLARQVAELQVDSPAPPRSV